MYTPNIIIRPYKTLGLPSRAVILTFDDGPSPTVTEPLLAVLARRGVHGYFCVVGEFAEAHPELILRIHESGHVLVNHSQTHNMFHLGKRHVEWEIVECDRVIGQALGNSEYRSRFFRPPCGLVTDAVCRVLVQREMRILPISFYAYDNYYTARNADRLLQRVLARVRKDGGGMMVLHEGLAHPFSPAIPFSGRFSDRSWLPQTVDTLIDNLCREGFSVGYMGEFKG